MKKIYLLIGFVVTIGLSKANAESFTLDNAKIDNLFALSQDVTSQTLVEANALSASNLNSAVGGQTVGGYLVRAFFCGSIALHRYYMGGSGPLWAMYLCIPVVGGVDGCVDFWWVLFNNDNLSKYRNSSKYIVWMD
jgi:hypothetical protein